jgi:hypothetical protein
MGESKHTIGKGLPLLLLLLLHKATNQQQRWRNVEVISSLVYSDCLLLSAFNHVQDTDTNLQQKQIIIIAHKARHVSYHPADLGVLLPMLQDPLREVKRKRREKTKTKDATKKNMGTRLR